MRLRSAVFADVSQPAAGYLATAAPAAVSRTSSSCCSRDADADSTTNDGQGDAAAAAAFRLS